MPLVIPPGFAHIGIEMRNSADPDPWFITFGIDSSGVSNDIEAIAESVASAWDAWLQPYTGSDTAQTGVQVTIGQDGGAPLRAFIANDANAGASAQPKLPQNCALLIRKNTAQGGRRNQGRMFVPGILDEADVSNTGVIGGTAMTTFTTAFAGFLDAIGSAVDPEDETPMVLLHSTGISDEGEPTVITSLTPDNVISTQRRRLR